MILFVLIACKNKSDFVKTNTIISEVDGLKTEFEIEKFIQKSDTNFKDYELKKIQEFNRRSSEDSINRILANKLNVNTSFTKVDLDNNGYTDLLAIGDDHSCFVCFSEKENESCSFTPIVVMNFGKNNVKIINILKERNSSIVPIVEYKKSQPFLIIYQKVIENWEKKIYKETRTKLTYKYGDFIEYNPHPKNHSY